MRASTALRDVGALLQGVLSNNQVAQVGAPAPRLQKAARAPEEQLQQRGLQKSSSSSEGSRKAAGVSDAARC